MRRLFTSSFSSSLVLSLLINILSPHNGIALKHVSSHDPSDAHIDDMHTRQPSNDANYEYMMTFYESTSSSFTHVASASTLESLLFYWNNPVDGVLSAKLVHTAAGTVTGSGSGPADSSLDSNTEHVGEISEFKNRIAWMCFGVLLSKPDGEKEMITGSKAMFGRLNMTEDAQIDTSAQPLYITILMGEYDYYQIKESHDGILLPDLDRNNIQQTQVGNELVTVLTFSQSLENWNLSPTEKNRFFYKIGRESQSSLDASFTLDFDEQGEHETSLVLGGKRAFFLHGLFGAAAFVICIPFAVVSVILRDVFPRKWMEYHKSCNIAGGILGILSFLFALIGKGVQSQRHFIDAHHLTGLALTIMVVFQVSNGLRRPGYKAIRIPSELVNNPDSLVPKRSSWLIVHRIVGFSVFVLGLYQTGNGLNKYAHVYKTTNLTPGLLVLVAIITASVTIGKGYVILFRDEIHSEPITDDEEDNENYPDEFHTSPAAPHHFVIT